MKIQGYIWAVCALLWACGATAQKTKTPAAQDTTSINKYDAQGRKEGMWLSTQPAGKGESSIIEFGSYDHGNRTGTWYKIDNATGDMVAIETYRDNVLNGEVKYYDMGRLSVVGHYRGLNPAGLYDTFYVTDPVTNDEVRRIFPADKGSLRHGLWQYFDTQTGRMVREEDYQVDDLLYRKDYPMSKQDSLYYQQREKNLPHNKYKHPRGKSKPINGTGG
jgi:antitoxin component YwqK of YwqJK toxin-antitoxin module